MEITNTSFHELNQNECLNNSVSCCSDSQAAVVSLVQDAECIAQVVLDLALGSHPDLVLSGLFFSLSSYLRRSSPAFVTLSIWVLLLRFFFWRLLGCLILSWCDS